MSTRTSEKSIMDSKTEKIKTNDTCEKLELKNMSDVKKYISEVIEVDGLNFGGVYFESKNKFIIKDSIILLKLLKRKSAHSKCKKIVRLR